MATTYELWETLSNNVIGAYATEAAALAVVFAQAAGRGKASVDSWTLLSEDENEEVTCIAGGHALLELAEKNPPRAQIPVR